MRVRDKILFVISILIFVFFFGITFLDQYQFTKVNKEDLIFAEGIFDHYTSSKNNYLIICEDGKEYKLSLIHGDEEHVNLLKNGDKLVLGMYDDRIVEMSVNDNKILSIEDCVENYKNQIKFISIFFPSFILLIIISIVVSNHFMKKFNKKNNIDGIKYKEELNEELYNVIQNSIYNKNGYLRCNILEQLDGENVEYTFYKALLDYIEENEIVLMIEDGCLNDEMAFVFYKENNKLYFNELFRDGEVPFEIDEILFWEYPFDGKVTKEEQQRFNYALNLYIQDNNEILKINKMK